MPVFCNQKLLHFQTKMEEKYLSVLGGPARLEARAGQGPSQAQVLAWVDEVFHDLRQNKVSGYWTQFELVFL